MGLKHIFVSLFIRIILSVQYQLPITNYYTDEINFQKNKAKWILNSRPKQTQTFFDVLEFQQKKFFRNFIHLFLFELPDKNGTIS